MPEIEVHSLASGSSGNSMLVRAGDRFLLIDAGLSARTLSSLLNHRGVHPNSLAAVLLTHEHDDHLRGAAGVARRFQAPVVANRATLHAASDRVALENTEELETGAETALGPFAVRSFAVSHDAAEPVGYVVTVGTYTVAYATDVGCVSHELRDAMRSASLCIIESNHDLEWLRRGPYPPYMKARVAGDTGHLSNEDAASLIAERLEQGPPAAFWLAHLSAVNNSPSFARKYAHNALKSRTTAAHWIEVALRDRPSLVWHPGQYTIQPSLF